MKKVQWAAMNTAQLVDEFAAIAREQDHALLANASAKYNRLYDRMAEIVDELKELLTGPYSESDLMKIFRSTNADITPRGPDGARQFLLRDLIDAG